MASFHVSAYFTVHRPYFRMHGYAQGVSIIATIDRTLTASAWDLSAIYSPVPPSSSFLLSHILSFVDNIDGSASVLLCSRTRHYVTKKSAPKTPVVHTCNVAICTGMCAWVATALSFTFLIVCKTTTADKIPIYVYHQQTALSERAHSVSFCIAKVLDTTTRIRYSYSSISITCIPVLAEHAQ